MTHLDNSGTRIFDEIRYKIADNGKKYDESCTLQLSPGILDGKPYWIVYLTTNADPMPVACIDADNTSGYSHSDLIGWSDLEYGWLQQFFPNAFGEEIYGALCDAVYQVVPFDCGGIRWDDSNCDSEKLDWHNLLTSHGFEIGDLDPEQLVHPGTRDEDEIRFSRLAAERFVASNRGQRKENTQ